MSDEAMIPIRAVTVVLLREGPDGRGVEVLLLRRSSRVSFGGVWVFPGGKVDEADGRGDRALRVAAQREVREETGLAIDPDTLAPLARWVPDTPGKRFDTTFFVARAPQGVIRVDGTEILDHIWDRPDELIRRHATREIELVAPTWMTLTRLSGFADLTDVFEHGLDEADRTYETRVMTDEAGLRIAVWAEDSAYGGSSLDASGARHRLYMGESEPWRLERSG